MLLATIIAMVPSVGVVMVAFVGMAVVHPMVVTGALLVGGGYNFAPIPIHKPTMKPNIKPINAPC
mgnify:CR=1 FL=1